MKIRADFVTNSSSSSYIMVFIKTKSGLYCSEEDETALIDLNPDFEIEEYSPISTKDDLNSLISVLFSSGGEFSVSTAGKDLLKQLENVDIKDIQSIEVNYTDEGYGESGEYGRTVFWTYDFSSNEWLREEEEEEYEDEEF